MDSRQMECLFTLHAALPMALVTATALPFRCMNDVNPLLVKSELREFDGLGVAEHHQVWRGRRLLRLRDRVRAGVIPLCL